MRKFQQNRLTRDQTIEIMEKQGSLVHWRHLDDEEFAAQLRLKLVEEAEEAAMAQNRRELINELGDLFEVIDTLAEINKISKSEIIEAQAAKLRERGGFSGRKFVTIAEHPVGSHGEKYCLRDPKKHPEVILIT